MKRRISIFTFLLSAFAVVGLSAFAATSESDSMRVSPIGYRLDATGDIMDYAPSVVTVTPGDTSIVSPKKPVTLTAVLDRDYKVVSWQKFDVNPTVRTEADPIEEFGEKSEAVSVSFATNVTWMYVTVVVKYEPVRTVKASLSSFAKGTVTVSPSKASYQKGDVVTLTAEPAEGYSFVRWSDGNADHVRELTLDGDVDLKAYIEPDSSRVSFSAGEGAAIDVTEKRVSFGNTYGELPVPMRTGAKFSGWMDDEKRTVTAKTEVDRVADHTLYAFWSDLLYEIAWDFTGRGNGKVDGAGTYAYGSQPTLKAVPYEGSAFVGWADGVTLNPRRITVLSNALYVAAFDVATYDVTFTYRDAAGNPVTKGPTTVEHGGKIDPPTIPEWPEHTFTNWSTEEYKKVTRDLAVEAIYDTMTYKVMFAYRDWQGNCVTTMPQHVVSGGKANPPDRSVVDNWTGNTFKGWAPDYNVIRQDTLCEAIYEINTYTVTFSYRGPDGELRETSEPVQHGDMVKAVPETAVVDNWPGHRFLGWSNEDYRCPIVGNLKVIARYEGYCEIDYRDALGTNLVEEVKDPKDWTNLRPVAELNEVEGYTFEKIGYEFSGWKTNEAGNVVYGDGARVRVQNGDVLALVSEWEPIQYKIGFDLNGATGDAVKDMGMTYDDGKPLPKLPSPPPIGTSLGRAFWTSERDNTNSICYKPGDVVSNLTSKAGKRVVLYAYWPKLSYDVKIDDGHGGTKTIPMEYGAEIDDPGAPADRTGYQFAGWLTNDVVVEEFPITVPVNGITLKADWTANEYTVAFHGNGADGKTDPQTFVYDKWQTLTPNGFTRTGYTFMGWATNATGAAVYKDRQSVRNLVSDEGAVVDLYATWTANGYKVRFNSGEGTGEMSDQDFIYDQPQALESNGFTRDRYVFAGWTNGEDAVAQYGDGEVVSNLTAEAGGVVMLWATWKDAPSYAVEYDANGGEGEMATNRFECGKGGKLPANGFTRTGYAFEQWTNKVNGATYGDGVTFAEDLAPTNGTATLSALWTPNRYWGAFDGNGADGGTMAAQAFTYDAPQALTSNAFTRTGYGFAGWKTNETGSAVFADGAVVSNLTATADATNTLWATWTAKSYEISFDSAGGSAVAPVTNEFGKAVSAPTPTKKGHQFDGWYEGEVEFDFTSMPARNVQLTAHWTANGYKVRFNSGEGTGEMSDQDFIYDQPQALESNGFTRDRYVFAGWTNGEDAVAQYGDGEVVSNLTAEAGGVVMLWATWKDAPSYAVEYDANGGEGEMATNRFECGKGGKLPANGFTRTGYAFDQWTNKVNGAIYGDSAPFTEDLAPTNGTATLSALWTPNRYWVRFEGNGATDGKMAPQAFTYDVAQPLTANGFSKTGHAFAGWATNATDKMAYVDRQVVSNLTAEANGTNTLWAVWAVKSYEIRFDPAGGGAVAPVTNEFGKAVSAPTPTKKGHQFDGWYEGEVEFDFTSMPARNVQLTAHWTANGYKVRFNSGEGTGEMSDQDFIYDQPQALEANRFTAPEMMVFDCWTNAVDSTTYANCEVVSNLATGGVFALYATWKEAPSYTVAFDGNGADGGSMSDRRFECGVGGMLPANGFTRTGYAFDQWTNKVNGAIYGDSATFMEDLAPTNGTTTLSALWTANRYWVKFEPNGADGGSMEAQAFTYDVAQALTSNAFTRTGYGFAGWATNATATGMSPPPLADGEVVSNLTAEADATNTLWATWTANQYIVKFNPNGGKGEVQSQGFMYDQSQKLADNTFDPPEDLKSFAGWATNETGEAVYANGAEVQNLTAEADGTVNLYAVWGDDSYTVTFDGNGATGGTMEPQVFKHGGTDTLTPNAYVRTGWGFKNWTNVSKNVYSDRANFTAPATDIGETLYAVWTNNTYDCTFVGRSEDNQRRKYGEELDPLPGNPSKTGYTFGGWTTNGTDKVDLKTFTMPDHDVVFTPLWTPIEYTIAFDGNGTTTVAIMPTNVKYNVEIALPSNTYAWAGHEFVHWTNSVGEVFENGKTVKNLATTDGATVTLYAVWKETGDLLRMALGLKPEFDGGKVSVSGGAWMIIEPAKEAKGVIRASTSADGQLRIAVPGSGTLSFTFEPLDDGANALKAEKEDGSWSKQWVDKIRYPISFDAAGAVIFSGTPWEGATWTLKNFEWTAK